MKKGDNKIGESLNRFRKAFNLTQAQVADKLGILQQSYYKYEAGRNMPPASVILDLAGAYGVSTDYLLGLSDEPRPPKLDEDSINVLKFLQEWKAKPAIHSTAQATA